MKIQLKAFRKKEDLKKHLKSHAETLFYASGTSTVIPYPNLGKVLRGKGFEHLYMGDLNALPQKMDFAEEGSLEIEGPVTWKDARGFCLNHGRNIMVSPTEELACMLAGIATSASGERSFGFGPLREHITEVEYLDFEGKEQTLYSKNLLINHPLFQSEKGKKLLEAYQKSYEKYDGFKNAPFPRLEKETDLMVGMEGQLGVVTKANFDTIRNETTRFLFIKLPKWEEDFKPHLEIFYNTQNFRDHLISVELLDHNCLSYLPDEEKPLPAGHDIIFLEVKLSSFDLIIENLVPTLALTPDDHIFEMNGDKCHHLRMLIPRFISEVNQRRGVKKKGTDVQVPKDSFETLINYYRDFSTKGISYNLFGHFGDGHLHFNFLPLAEEEEKCQNLLTEFYRKIKSIHGSPFAEHGIGLLKQDFIAPFLTEVQLEMYRYLKENLDPKNQFFPQGFLNLFRGNKND